MRLEQRITGSGGKQHDLSIAATSMRCIMLK
jgi:hypothetical protein